MKATDIKEFLAYMRSGTAGPSEIAAEPVDKKTLNVLQAYRVEMFSRRGRITLILFAADPEDAKKRAWAWLRKKDFNWFVNKAELLQQPL